MTQTSELSGDATIVGDDRESAAISMHGETMLALSRGAAVGRYIVLDRLGVGGMGVVYRAIDPELDRKVALKLLRFADDPRGADRRSRLLREAQAMARVRHPNVVTVHDVGTQHEQVWVAMELVEGQTLRRWLETPRSWSEVLAVMLQAGEGLRAAHAQHLVHRDLKPDNVMVAADGRVLVMDFGLARGHDDPLELLDEERLASASSVDLLSTEITRAGVLMGTPAYMSPEQLEGHDADARSDQFAFCVTLFEALHGQRPFRSDEVMGLVLAITRGEVQPPSTGRGVPGWLHRVVMRGLAPRADERWPSMEALLQALRNPPGLRRRRWLVRGAGALAVGGALAGALLLPARADERCTDAAQRLDGVWDEGLEARVRDAVQALALPWAQRVTEGMLSELDAYAAAWVEQRTEACQATVVHGSQSQEAMDLRMACLDRARMDLQATATQLVEADAEVMRNLHALASGLPPLSQCEDVEGLRAEVPPPAEPEARAQAEALRQRLADARGLQRAGKYAAAQAAIEALAPRVEVLEHPPLSAALLMAQGANEEAQGRYPQARARYEDALHLSLGSGLRSIQRSSTVALAKLVATFERKPAEAMVYGRMAVALVQGTGIEPQVAAAAHNALGAALVESGQYPEAVEAYQRALALELGDDPVLVGSLHNNLGNALQLLGRADESLVELQRAVALYEEALGPDHPEMVGMYNNVANTLQQLQRYDEAVTEYRAALALAEQVLHDEHPSVARTHFNLGSVLARAGRAEEAEPELERALELVEKSLGADHSRAGLVHGNLAVLLLGMKRGKDAELHARRSLEILEATLGADHPDNAGPLSLLGQVLHTQGRCAEAEALQLRALAIRERALPPGHTGIMLVLERLGQERLDQGRPAEALEPLERAVAGYEASDPENNRPRAAFRLAQALWETDEDRPRALALVGEAIEGQKAGSLRNEMSAWRREHAP